MPIGIKPTVDFAFKKIFGSPENAISLIGLLNAILDLPEPITDVEILNPFNRQEFLEDKLIVLDVKARDCRGRTINVEMQVSVHPGLLSRLTYYACSLFVEQLGSGDDYLELRPAISICLLSNTLFGDSEQAHHRFRLVDTSSGRTLDNGIEVHTVELPKYNLDARTISQADAIEQWAFFLRYADRYEPDELRDLLPAVEFQQAIAVIENIAEKTDDKTMYDERLKAQRDYQWVMSAVRKEGIKEGREIGHEEGHELGVQEGREEGVKEGREEGVKEGLGAAFGLIQTLQQLLGDEVASAERLEQLAAAELKVLITELQQRVRNRDA